MKRRRRARRGCKLDRRGGGAALVIKRGVKGRSGGPEGLCLNGIGKRAYKHLLRFLGRVEGHRGRCVRRWGERRT